MLRSKQLFSASFFGYICSCLSTGFIFLKTNPIYFATITSLQDYYCWYSAYSLHLCSYLPNYYSIYIFSRCMVIPLSRALYNLNSSLLGSPPRASSFSTVLFQHPIYMHHCLCQCHHMSNPQFYIIHFAHRHCNRHRRYHRFQIYICNLPV